MTWIFIHDSFIFYSKEIMKSYIILFERELALLVALQGESIWKGEVEGTIRRPSLRIYVQVIGFKIILSLYILIL